MKERIITDRVSRMRIKIAKPARNRCIRKLRELRIWLFGGRLPVSPDDAPETLFWLLLRAEAFPAEYSEFLHKGRLSDSLDPVRVEPLPQQSKRSFGVELRYEDQPTPEYRERLTLSLRGTEATLTFSALVLEEDSSAAPATGHSAPEAVQHPKVCYRS